ncbi:MAG: glycosyltransferase family 39 protein [Anaerolinea sp.]|nr:glycosyltransferase family 39 protein [Anaerolinea sp.]
MTDRQTSSTRRVTWIILTAILIFAAVLRVANLEALGDGNQYYTAAVASMLQSPSNFFFASAEPGGGVSIDKPPVALWVQTISAAILGVSGFSVALPSIIAGVLSCALLYHLVARRFGAVAGLIAAFVLATTPISIAVDGTNNLDSLLIFTLLLATWAFIRAVETRKLVPLLIGVTLVGVGFNIKMLQAYLILPALYAFYFFGAKIGWGRKIVNLAGAATVLLVVSLTWAVIVDLTPTDARPYVGGSDSNSVIELALGYNGLARVTGNAAPGGGQPNASTTDSIALTAQINPPPGGAPPNGDDGRGAGGQGAPTGTEVGEPTLFRLFTAPLENELSWALPLALVLLGVLIVSERPRLPLGEKHQNAVLWGGWLLTGMGFFTVSRFYHAYYLATIAPPLAALIGIGAVAVWRSNRTRLFTFILIGGVIATVAYQWITVETYGESILIARLAAVIALAMGIVTFGVSFALPKWRRIAVPALVASALIIPAAWGVLTAQEASTNSVLPAAYDGARSEGMGGGIGMTDVLNDAIAPILDYLQTNQTSKYLLAVSSSMIGAPIVLETNEPVLYIGGFNGTDQIYSADSFATLVESGDVRYVLTGGSNVDQWVTETCSVVEEVSVDLGSFGGGLPGMRGGQPPAGFEPPAGMMPPGMGGSMPALYDCAAAL